MKRVLASSYNTNLVLLQKRHGEKRSVTFSLRGEGPANYLIRIIHFSRKAQYTDTHQRSPLSLTFKALLMSLSSEIRDLLLQIRHPHAFRVRLKFYFDEKASEC
jgi:hypothetical protein